MVSSLKYFWKAVVMFVCSVIQLFGALFRVISELFGWCSKKLDLLCEKSMDSLESLNEEPETYNRENQF